MYVDMLELIVYLKKFLFVSLSLGNRCSTQINYYTILPNEKSSKLLNSYGKALPGSQTPRMHEKKKLLTIYASPFVTRHAPSVVISRSPCWSCPIPCAVHPPSRKKENETRWENILPFSKVHFVCSLVCSLRPFLSVALSDFDRNSSR